MNTTKVGFDPGNSTANIIFVHNQKTIKASIPSRYAFQCPPGEISAKTRQALKPKAFMLLIGSKELWFGPDVLGVPSIQEIDMAKYEPKHLTILFRAALYAACKKAKISLADLGRLEIVASMPPGLFQDPAKNKAARRAFGKAFNRGQSHLWIRDGKDAAQIVTKFLGLQQEAVGYAQGKKRSGPFSLTIDLGGGTNDYALFNSAAQPLQTWTDNDGLLFAFDQIDRINPARAELEILRNKKSLPHQILQYFNAVKIKVQKIAMALPGASLAELHIIGGGAALMTPEIKATFTPLASKVVIANEFANAEANLKAAVK
jgi:hypothetical protein